MTASIATLGDNSARITYTAGTLLAEVMAQVETYLALRGWVVYDAAAGTNAVCYRSLQPGGTAGTTAHYHYLVLDYNQSGYVIARLFELWDSTAHTGTNKAPNTFYAGSTVAETALAQRIDRTNGGTLDIHAAARFVVLLSVLTASGAVGAASGGGATVICTRERSEDTDTLAAGYPSAVWLNAANAMSSTRFDYHVSLPRAPVAGSTPTTASQQSELYAPGMMWKGTFSSGAAVSVALVSNLYTGRAFVSDLIVGLAGPYVWGRIYDVLVMPNAQAGHNDTVICPVDGSGFFSRGSGTTKSMRALYSTVAGGNVLLVPW